MGLIITCDDDEDTLTLLHDFLESRGHTVIRSYDVSQLWSLMQHKKPDLLIIDMQMPAGGGPGAMNYLREIGASRQPLIIVSAMPVDKQKVWASDRGLNNSHCIQKPFDLYDIERAVGEHCPHPWSDKDRHLCQICGKWFKPAADRLGTESICTNCLPSDLAGQP